MAIHVLDRHTAELIAAGEVVERPSSVVKELCENAIDAGAHNISVEIARGGIALIRVADDGAGIAEADIPLAFVRHATSKVRSAEDLVAIQTLGFRGEALASIASVAQVELLTKTAAAEHAGLYAIAGGQGDELAAAARPVGTTITVQNLFYNTPARMKFLKKDASEGTFVAETVTRLALSHPEIAFRFVRDGKEQFHTPGDGKLASAVYVLLGASFARELVPVAHAEGQYGVAGLVTQPRAGRASRAMQFFFINGRFVKNRTMMAAMEQAYRSLQMQGRFPGGVLTLAMPAELVDVNVHPAKTEVRFARENDVFEAVYRAVKAALLQTQSQFGQFAFGAQGAAAAAGKPSSAEQGAAADVQADAWPGTPGAPQTALPGGGRGAGGGENRPPQQQVAAYNSLVDTLASTAQYAPYATRPLAGVQGYAAQGQGQSPRPEPGPDVLVEDEPAPAPPVQTQMPAAAAAPLRLVGEIFGTYILAEADGALCLIDKHAAHERILYERIAATRKEAGSQQLLVPATVNLSAAEKDALLQNREALLEAGVEVADFGAGSVLVRGVPADVAETDVAGLVVEIAARLCDNPKDTLTEKTEWVLHSMACRAAVKAGDKTPPGQLLRLAEDILSGAVPPYCPHGRPVVLQISHKELEKQFGRLG